MIITLDTDSQGRDVALFTARTGKVVTIRQLAKHRDGTTIDVDLDERNEVLGLVVIGKIKVVDKRGLCPHCRRSPCICGLKKGQ